MIFVILGTQDKQFCRLIKEIEELKKDGIIKEKVVVQAGCTKYKSKEIEILEYIPMTDFTHYIKKAKYIITHGGVGSILDSLKYNKKVIAIPRLEKYNEHVNDHQIEIIEKFDELGFILDCGNLKRLGNKIIELENFKPKKYISNNNKMINLLEKFIGE